MVSEGDKVVAHGIHDRDDVAALRDGAHAASLHEVTRGDDGHIGCFGLFFSLEGGHLGVAIHRTVYVVVVEDDDRVGSLCAG